MYRKGVYAMVTIKDVAAKAGVSKTTASDALRGGGDVSAKTMQRVRAIAEQMGYKPNVSARSLRSGRSNTITFLTSGIQGSYFAEVATYFAEEINRRGMYMLIELTKFVRDDAKQKIPFPMSDGIIATNALHVDRLLREHPTVVLENYDDECPYDTVNASSAAGSRAAIRHLAERGCTRIAVVGDNSGPGVYPGSRDLRYESARDECRKLGLRFDDDSFVRSQWSRQGGIETGHALADAGMPFDGLYCLSDGIALGVIRGLNERGVRVPDDVAVMGFDGVLEGRYYSPSLTSVRTDFSTMARVAMDLLMHRIEHPDDKAARQCMTVGYEIAEGESTAR